MNTILVDLGNSRCKWVAAEWVGKVEAEGCEYGEDAVSAVVGCLQAVPNSKLVFASVLSETVNENLRYHLERLGNEVRFLDWRDCGSLSTAYADPSRLGIDRYLAMIGARQRYDCPLVVVDAGTAVTVDALDVNGKHMGGAIFPGLGVLRKLLAERTANIGQQPEMPNTIAFGRSTGEAVNAGITIGFHGAIEALVFEMCKELGGKASVICTGGDGKKLIIPGGPFQLEDSTLIFTGMLAVMDLL
jgi:type III pantothenate kinase